MNELKIHDIKALSQIPDYSFYLFILLIIIALLLTVSFVIFIYKKLKNKESKQKKSFKVLQNIDFTDAKQSAYLITEHARIVAITPRDKKLLEELIEELDTYKYKKEVANISEASTQKFKIFMESIDVK